MANKNKSITEAFIESLSPQEKREYQQDYIELSLNELLHEAMQTTNINVRELAKISGVSSNSISDILKDEKEEVNMRHIVALLNSLGYKFFVEKNGETIALDSSIVT